MMRGKPTDAQAGMAQGVDYLLRKFAALEADMTAPAYVPIGGQATGPIETDYLLATSDARAALRAQADAKASGSGDDEEFDALADAIGVEQGGVLQITAGDLSISDRIYVGSAVDNIWVRGSGWEATRFVSAGSSSPDRFGFVYIEGDHQKLSDCTVRCTGLTYYSGVAFFGDYDSVMERVAVYLNPAVECDPIANLRAAIWCGTDQTIRTCWVQPNSEGTGIFLDGDNSLVEDCRVQSSTAQGLLAGDGILVAGDYNRIVANHVDGAIAGYGIKVTGDGNVLLGNYAPDGILIDTTADGTIVGGNTGTVTDNGTNTVYLDNTPNPQGQLYLTTPAATTISATDTPTKAAGTTVLLTDPLAVDFTMPSNNRLTYGGPLTRLFFVTAAISATCASNNQLLGFEIAKNGTAVLGSHIDRWVGTGSDHGAITIQALVELAEDDYVEVFVDNGSSTGNITLEHFNLIAAQAG